MFEIIMLFAFLAAAVCQFLPTGVEPARSPSGQKYRIGHEKYAGTPCRRHQGSENVMRRDLSEDTRSERTRAA